jgi:cytochrome c peroxidase
MYRQKMDSFAACARMFRQAVLLNRTDSIQPYFFSLRKSYKEAEALTEYFFRAFAQRLNGPPIPFFEESEPYVLVNEPAGMQVIEGLVFPRLDLKNKEPLIRRIDELLRFTKDLADQPVTFEFTDANLFDAFMEEAYRVTALGLTGFDSQTAGYSLTECASALKGLRQFLSLYRDIFLRTMPGTYEKLQILFDEAVLYFQKNNSFNQFDRMYFITRYMNPVTSIIGEYKIVNRLADNPSAYYYSSISKTKTLFSPGAFNSHLFSGDFSVTPQKAEFGRMLFFEPRLSSTKQRSCASCHLPGKAFTDGLKTSEAIDGHSSLLRNAPTIWNAALQRNVFWDSRSRSLEDQVLQVLSNSKEMNGNPKAVAQLVLSIDKYLQLYSDAYPGAKPEDAVKNICNAIACYEHTLIALNSRFDKQMNGGAGMTKKEISGFNIFMGKAKCATCHFIPLFSGSKPPRFYHNESEVLGVPARAVKKNARLDPDSGRYLITQSPVHLFSFKTPTLRNIELTAPYMHNGVFRTLDEIVDFYNKGGGQSLGIAPPNQTLPFEKLGLTMKEKKNLVAFMKTLTDTTTVKLTND